MSFQRDFEEGMCSQDVEKFRQQNGLPMNGVYDDDDEDPVDGIGDE